MKQENLVFIRAWINHGPFHRALKTSIFKLPEQLKTGKMKGRGRTKPNETTFLKSWRPASALHREPRVTRCPPMPPSGAGDVSLTKVSFSHPVTVLKFTIVKTEIESDKSSVMTF